MEQRTTFYLELQNSSSLDLRDPRGKIHDLPLLLVEIVISLLRNRDGCLSSIHRSMLNTRKALCLFLGIDNQQVISRSHFPVVLKKVKLSVLEELLFKNFGIELSEIERSWFACDGKELRGSILSGDKRGEAIVQLVRQSDNQTLNQAYYNGTKESEKPCLRTLLEESEVLNQKISMDALHLCPETLESIALSGGTYLVGLKNNQKELLEDMEKATTYLRIENQEVTIDKGHGRLEKREYYAYNIGGEYFDKRWNDTDFQTLIKIDRHRMDLKTRVESHETAYYMCNQKIIDFYNKNKLTNICGELFQAVRGHWAVETSNHIRDVSLKEDKLKTKKNEVSKVFSTLRTLVTNALKVEKYKNIKAQLENFSDNFDELLAWLRKISFL